MTLFAMCFFALISGGGAWIGYKTKASFNQLMYLSIGTPILVYITLIVWIFWYKFMYIIYLLRWTL